MKKIKKRAREKKSVPENIRAFVSVKLIFVPVKNWKKCVRESPKIVREKFIIVFEKYINKFNFRKLKQILFGCWGVITAWTGKSVLSWLMPNFNLRIFAFK